MKKSLYVFVFSLIASLVVLSPVFAQDTVVVPNNRADVGANGSFRPPFNCQGLPPTGIRWQQIYAGSEIGQAGMIDKVSFRLNGVFEGTVGDNGFNALYPNVVVQLSTTDKAPVDAGGDPMSNTFNDNIGADVKTVYSGNLTLSAQNCFREIPTISVPCPFDVMIPLQEMFEYDPANGNLLLDLRIPQCPALGEFVPDFDFATSGIDNNEEKISFAFAANVGATDGTGVSGSGLVTQFRFFIPININVPTLSEWGLISMAALLGIVGFMVIRRRKATTL